MEEIAWFYFGEITTSKERWKSMVSYRGHLHKFGRMWQTLQNFLQKNFCQSRCRSSRRRVDSDRRKKTVVYGTVMLSQRGKERWQKKKNMENKCQSERQRAEWGLEEKQICCWQSQETLQAGSDSQNPKVVVSGRLRPLCWAGLKARFVRASREEAFGVSQGGRRRSVSIHRHSQNSQNWIHHWEKRK